MGAPHDKGRWTSVTDSPNLPWPESPIHAHLLPFGPHAGQVLFWGRGHIPRDQSRASEPHFWDPNSKTVTAAAQPTFNAFCSGHAFLAFGKLLVAGGHKTSYNGLPNASKYDPEQNMWSSDLDDMNEARWYPTTIALPHGDALVISGTNVGQGDPDNTPQVLRYNQTTWSGLSADMNLPSIYYPFMFVAPFASGSSDERVFLAGPKKDTRFLYTNGSGTWEGQAQRYLHDFPRNWGSAVMYDKGKIIIMGGTDCGFYDGNCTNPPFASAERIDLTAASPAWTSVPSMPKGPRKLHNATLLANGKVFVSGGRRDSASPKAPAPSPTDTPGPAALKCEMWDPSSGQNGSWFERAPLPKYRGYHSIALLLPDATVLSAGGDHQGGDYSQSDPDDYTAEVFEPPYLFDSNDQLADRPEIINWPSPPPAYNYGATINVEFTVPANRSIVKVNLLGVGSVTHGFNMGQRCVPITTFVKDPNANILHVTISVDESEAPSGYYMLFVIDNNPNGGVPSKAQFVRLNRTLP